MGGLSCVAGKPDEDADTRPVNSRLKERRESQRPWNRHSLQVYCGDPKSKSDTSPDKPPGETDKSNTTDDNALGDTAVAINLVDSESKPVEIPTNEIITNAKEYKVEKCKHLSTSSETESLDKEVPENKTCNSAPDIVNKTDNESPLPSPVKLHSPPLIAPFNPGNKVIKRPRSLDTVVNYRPIYKSRPLSYSPGLMKCRHPRSLHSINEIPQIRERPQSMDVASFFESKGFDIHTQKLRRIRTQKSPTKKSSLDHSARKHNSFDHTDLLQPNHIKYLEEGPSRCFQPSQMINRKKKNRDLKWKEVLYLRKALLRPRMKFSKSLEIFFQRNEQYLEYDPFLDSNAAHPGNPWITDDETFWEINRKLVEVPTVMRIKKWALSFSDLLRDDTGRCEFEHFLKKEYSQENIAFIKACKELMMCPQSKLHALKNSIEREFLTPGAPCEVNIDCKTMEVVVQHLKADKDINARYIFQPAMDHVYALMKKDSYSRFLRSEQYKALFTAAQTHYSKKRLFNFGSNRKKTPSPQVRRRGSTSSDNAMGPDGEIGGSSYHSYSTGNLRELDEKPKRAMSAISRQTTSPAVRRRADERDTLSMASKDGRRRSNLDVPRASSAFSNVPAETAGSRKSEALSQCLALSVPRTNIVTPWEGES